MKIPSNLQHQLRAVLQGTDLTESGVAPGLAAICASTSRGVIEADLAGRVAHVEDVDAALLHLRKWCANAGPFGFTRRHRIIDDLDRSRDSFEHVLLDHVKMAWGHPTTYVARTSDPEWWGVRCPGFGGYMGVGRNALSALVAALASERELSQ